MPLSLLCDEHIPYAVIDGLRLQGIDAVSVQSVGLRSTIDPDILDAATQRGRVTYTSEEQDKALTVLVSVVLVPNRSEGLKWLIDEGVAANSEKIKRVLTAHEQIEELRKEVKSGVGTYNS